MDDMRIVVHNDSTEPRVIIVGQERWVILTAGASLTLPFDTEVPFVRINNAHAEIIGEI